MKANELMIGDLVCYSEPNNYYTKVEEIRCTSDGEEYYIRCHRDSKDTFLEQLKYEDFSVDILHPIPLTPEILEKNGFIIKKKWAQIGNFGDNPLIMWHFEDDAFLHDFKHELEIHQNDTGKVHIRIPCEYLHELQHALRLCGICKTIEI